MPVLCLVPTPLAAARAARRLCDAQGGLLFGPSVSTLERLVPGMLAAAGDRRAVLPPLAERLLAAGAGADAGGPFAGMQASSGLAGALAAAIAELRRAEVTAADARATADEGGLPGAAAARLRALADALAAYEARLDGLGALDRAGAARTAAGAAARGAASAETAGLDLLLLDGHVALAPAEWDLFAALMARARRTRVHLPYFPERPDLCAPAEPLLRRLEALHEVAARRDVEVVLPHVDGADRAVRPSALLAAFAGGPGAGRAAGPEGQVLALPGAGEAGEAEAVAEAVERLLASGLAPEDVAVVSPAPRRAGPALARALAARGLPFASGRGPALAEVPLARWVREALAAAGDLGRAAAERLLASGWLAAPGGGAVGPVLDRAGALDGRGSPGAALRRRLAALGGAAGRERAAVARAAGAVEALEAAIRPLASPGTARAHAARLSAFLDASGVRRRAARGPRAEVARDLAALAGLEEAAEAVVRASALLGEAGAALAPAAFLERLGLAVDQAALPPGPEAAAGAVELSGLDEAPGLSARAVVVTGARHGAFPAAPPPEPLLRDPERLALNRRLRRAALPPTGARRAEATYRAFAALAAGREAVAITWAAPGPGGDGGPVAPLAAEALVAAGAEVAGAAVAPEPPLSRARTVRAALRAAARAGDAGAAALAGTVLAPRAADALRRGAIESARRDAVLARRPAPFAGQVEAPALAALAAALPEEWAPTRLEGFARCPFRGFLAQVLRLPDRAAADLDIDPRDEGSLLHAVLERFVRGRMERRAWPPDGGEADLAEMRAAAAEAFARFEREGRTGDPAAWAARREAVLARLDRVVRAEARDHGGLAPAAVELRFGRGGLLPALELAWDGERVRLEGRVDRIDAGPGRLLVVDYKNARNGDAYADGLDPEAFGDAAFQIPAYLMAAARAFPGRPRLEATYALLRRAERLEPVALDADAPLIAAQPAPPPPGGPEAPRPFAAAVVERVRQIRAGAFAIASRGCDGCPFGAVCRFQGTAALAERVGGAAGKGASP
ncbi:ATP-dependent nuclease subunit B-like protein [Anaeromyxobacter dehalogenans 2CP-1]|uniref:ATP-dependent nuclease subunit B-like protein n=1 Tax=Anaeromyxobacter dehalogenans (strain ATCC BAA-258 / DSM 21875 / 2CP-1) TaxID=455488 RepID=B8JH80_ANAD2|nr:PD-(D/E)XK nuclease family protein [Anaeromyxobacter dehalogenans]ACL64782.1 ATP-dependent nuclease subunit B-like protein [Anaeromyxobacter dehalogenans 2CP-1]